MGCNILVLIPKGNINTTVIGLSETLWKVAEALIDTRLRTSLQLHGVLHRFRTRRGTGTAIMELKFAHDISSIDWDPLFLVFLDLRKAYDTVHRDQLLITMEGYGVGPRM